MTASMENSAAQLIAIHHNEATKVALQHVGVAVVAIDDGTGNGIGDVAPADGKGLVKETVVSNIDRNGKRGWRKQNRAERRLIWLYRAFASTA